VSLKATTGYMFGEETSMPEASQIMHPAPSASCGTYGICDLFERL
jgi:hypothetical protein